MASTANVTNVRVFTGKLSTGLGLLTYLFKAAPNETASAANMRRLLYRNSLLVQIGNLAKDPASAPVMLKAAMSVITAQKEVTGLESYFLSCYCAALAANDPNTVAAFQTWQTWSSKYVVEALAEPQSFYDVTSKSLCVLDYGLLNALRGTGPILVSGPVVDPIVNPVPQPMAAVTAGPQAAPAAPAATDPVPLYTTDLASYIVKNSGGLSDPYHLTPPQNHVGIFIQPQPDPIGKWFPPQPAPPPYHPVPIKPLHGIANVMVNGSPAQAAVAAQGPQIAPPGALNAPPPTPTLTQQQQQFALGAATGTCAVIGSLAVVANNALDSDPNMATLAAAVVATTLAGLCTANGVIDAIQYFQNAITTSSDQTIPSTTVDNSVLLDAPSNSTDSFGTLDGTDSMFNLLPPPPPAAPAPPPVQAPAVAPSVPTPVFQSGYAGPDQMDDGIDDCAPSLWNGPWQRIRLEIPV